MLLSWAMQQARPLRSLPALPPPHTAGLREQTSPGRFAAVCANFLRKFRDVPSEHIRRLVGHGKAPRIHIRTRPVFFEAREYSNSCIHTNVINVGNRHNAAPYNFCLQKKSVPRESAL